MRSHFMLSGRVAMTCAVSGATTLLAGVCSAQIASDVATNPAYADGWQPGDNGGFGFSAWSMNGTYNSATQHTLDSTSPFNQLGQAWTLFNPNGSTNATTNPINPPDGGTDISQAGRGFTPLQVGDTITTIIDNPDQRQFFRGYTIRLVSGSENTTYGGTAVSRLAVGTFEYFTNGRWFAGGNTTLFDTDTDAGMRLDVTLTGADTYSLTMTPLDNPGNFYTESGTLAGAAGLPINWIEFEFYNTDSDHNPSAVGGALATDFYIRSIAIVPEPCTWALLGLGSAGLLFFRRRK